MWVKHKSFIWLGLKYSITRYSALQSYFSCCEVCTQSWRASTKQCWPSFSWCFFRSASEERLSVACSCHMLTHMYFSYTVDLNGIATYKPYSEDPPVMRRCCSWLSHCGLLSGSGDSTRASFHWQGGDESPETIPDELEVQRYTANGITY